jgi:hypothetical protein
MRLFEIFSVKWENNISMLSNIPCFQKGAHYADIKISNSLPPSLKTISVEKETFKVALKIPKYTHTPFILLMNFYSLKRTHNPCIVCCIAVDLV